jgi:hypothetical protein
MPYSIQKIQQIKKKSFRFEIFFFDKHLCCRLESEMQKFKCPFDENKALNLVQKKKKQKVTNKCNERVGRMTVNVVSPSSPESNKRIV